MKTPFIKSIFFFLISVILALNSTCTSPSFNRAEREDEVFIVPKPTSEYLYHKLLNATLTLRYQNVSASGIIVKKERTLWSNKYTILTVAHFAEVINLKDKSDSSVAVVSQINNKGVMGQEYITILRVVKISQDKDLALLEGYTIFDIGQPVIISSSLPKLGAVIYSSGSPMGIDRVVSHGEVLKYFNNKGFLMMETNCQIFFGSSGGGIFNDRGELVGITVSMKDDRAWFINMALCADSIEGFLKE